MNSHLIPQNSFPRESTVIWIRIFISYIFIILMAFFPFIAKAQDTITLSDAISRGISNKNNILAGNINVAISDLQIQALHRKYWPTLSAEYNYQYNPILQTSIIPIGVFNPALPADATRSVQFGTKWSQSAGLSGSIALLDLSIKRTINESKQEKQVAEYAQAQLEFELTYTIAQTYIEIFGSSSFIVGCQT